MRTENLLVEIGTEELPPKALSSLAQAFADNMQLQLEGVELSFDAIKWYASPRRLAVTISNLAGQQQDKLVEKRGPAVSAAFDADGNATKAAQGWARSNGIEVTQAERLVTDKGEWLLHKAEVKGKGLADLLAGLVDKALGKLPIPKPMRWGAKRTQFIRPVHTVCMLYGDELIAGDVLGITSSKQLQGHRFHSTELVELDHADNYLSVMKDAFVIADFQERKQLISAQINRAASNENALADIDESLLDEVTALVEWPVTLVADFEEKFLDVPKEALIYTMKDDQKYFPLLAEDGKLLPRFLFVTNIESKDPQQIISGNEKVIRPRLADAEFFYNTDKKRTLESRLDSLETVLFQKQLGTLKDKSERIALLAEFIAIELQSNPANAYRAGLLSKTDLMTEMVMEFTDVQGVMGMYYALNDGEDKDVALALDEQYKPRFAGDELPHSSTSCAVALADKIDTLVGIFGIGQLPKGDKDPFALRRAAIGVLRIIVEHNLQLDLVDLIEKSTELFGDKLSNENVKHDVVDFILGRFRAWYQDQDIDVDVIQAVMAKRPTRPADFDARIKGVSYFRSQEAAQALAAANKRVANILAKNQIELDTEVDPSLLLEDAELSLFQQIEGIKAEMTPSLMQGDYQQVLTLLSGLRINIDLFFDNVMVMADDVNIRNNRIALLRELRSLFMQVADISLLSN